MKIKLKLCSVCLENKIIWKKIKGENYCLICLKFHNLKEKSKDTPVKKRNPIRKVSSKKQIADKIYSKERVPFLEKNSMCQAAFPGCTGVSTDVHHTEYQGVKYLDQSTWRALCRHCHSYLHANPAMAREMGLLK